MARTATELTAQELALVQALDALAVSGASQAIRKSGTTTLANVNVSGGGTPVYGEPVTGAINGSNTSYTIANTPSAGTLRVYLNGRRLQTGAGNDYTFSGTTIAMNYAPETASTLISDYEF